MDTSLFLEMLSIDSSSGKERGFSEFLARRLMEDIAGRGIAAPVLSRHEVGDGTENLLFAWGEPEIVFCTHMDTVPPYIPPTLEEGVVRGRGACDAKGQIISMYEACCALAKEGCRDFGLLLLSGEETGSFGAKAFARDCKGGEWVIVGEPTEGKMTTASKGTKSFDVEIIGREAHSGYPGLGSSAVEAFVSFMQRLRATDFPKDPILGETTWNVGKLFSDNPQNILSGHLSFKLYFRTTFESDALVCEWMERQKGVEYAGDRNTCTINIKANGGDTPMHYNVVEGMNAGVVAFGSDAPRLTNFAHRMLCGAGSISVAHKDCEYVELSALEEMSGKYVSIYHSIKS